LLYLFETVLCLCMFNYIDEFNSKQKVSQYFNIFIHVISRFPSTTSDELSFLPQIVIFILYTSYYVNHSVYISSV